MKRDRKHQILWEMVDTMFTKIEYWNEDPTNQELTEEEFVYLRKTISALGKRHGVTDHVNSWLL